MAEFCTLKILFIQLESLYLHASSTCHWAFPDFPHRHLILVTSATTTWHTKTLRMADVIFRFTVELHSSRRLSLKSYSEDSNLLRSCALSNAEKFQRIAVLSSSGSSSPRRLLDLEDECTAILRKVHQFTSRQGVRSKTTWTFVWLCGSWGLYICSFLFVDKMK